MFCKETLVYLDRIIGQYTDCIAWRQTALQ